MKIDIKCILRKGFDGNDGQETRDVPSEAANAS